MKHEKNIINFGLSAMIAGASLIPGFATLGFINDRIIVFDIKKSLFHEFGFKSLKVHLSCHEGFIIISGYADSNSMKSRIINIISHTPGVLDIKKNNVYINS